MNKADTEYLNTVKRILKEGTVRGDRTGTGTISLFGPQMEFDLQEGFPLLTTKKLPFRVIAEELRSFIKGETNLKDFLDKNVNIWNDDAYRDFLENGGELDYDEFIEMARVHGYSLGPIYGAQWRNWNGDKIDQLDDAINQIKNNPDSRRLLISAWNPSKLDNMVLPPCHVFYQYYVENGRLSCKLYQRSADFFLGVPFNIASYALKTHVVAKMTGLEVGRFIHTFGDAHIYLNHIDQIKLQLSRTPKELPKLTVKTVHDRIEDYTMDDFVLEGYDPHPVIKGKVSVGLDNKNTTI